MLFALHITGNKTAAFAGLIPRFFVISLAYFTFLWYTDYGIACAHRAGARRNVIILLQK